MATDTRADALKRAAKLLALATSNNAHEAAVAARMAQEVMDKHGLNAAMLTIDGAPDPVDDEPIVDFMAKGAPLADDGGAKVETWRLRLAHVLSKANACRSFQRTGTGKIEIVGRPSDVDTVRYLYVFFTTQTLTLADRWCKGCVAVYTRNFKVGVVEGIVEALAQSKRNVQEQAKREARDNTADGSIERSRAMVRVTTAIEKTEKRAAQVDEWVTKNMRLSKVPDSGKVHDKARAEGREHGRKIQHSGARGALGSGKE